MDKLRARRIAALTAAILAVSVLAAIGRQRTLMRCSHSPPPAGHSQDTVGVEWSWLPPHWKCVYEQ